MKDFTRQRILLFVSAGALGILFNALSIPIPYMLGGIVAAFVAKTFIDPKTKWPSLWRNMMMSVAGYEIGRSCSVETLINIAEEIFGVFLATGVTVIVSILAAFWTFRHSAANLISCVMGCSPGGMSLMTLMAEEDSRVDMNVVVVAQTLRLFCVVVSVLFLAMQMIDETSAAVALEKPDEWHWLALIPICFVGRFLGKKTSSADETTARTDSRDGTLRDADSSARQSSARIDVNRAAEYRIVYRDENGEGQAAGVAPDDSEFAVGQRGDDRLKRGDGNIPVANIRVHADNGVPGDVAWRDNGNVYRGLGNGRERPADFGISAVQIADDKFRVAVRDKLVL